MTYVGLDIAKCSDLKAHLDQAAADLNAHAATVEALLAQAGIQSCRAPAEIRDVAAWAAYRSRDLQKRIERARAADSGGGASTPTGFRFASGADARKAGAEEANRIEKLARDFDEKAAHAELDKIRPYASDPNFAAAFLGQLGPEGLAALLKALTTGGPARRSTYMEDMGLLAGMLARLSTSPRGVDQKLSAELLERLRQPDLLGELAVLLSFGGFSSSFTADAARAILGSLTGMAANSALGTMEITGLRPRDVALQALGNDVEAAYLFVTRASMDELRALLDDPGDKDGGALAAKILQTGLLDGRATRPGDLVHIEDALERVMLAIAKGAPLTDAARAAVAKALYPEIVDGTIPTRAAFSNDGPSTLAGLHVSKETMEKVFAELMKTDQSRAELMRGVRDYAAKELSQAIVTGRDLDSACKRVGALLGVVTVGARSYLHDEQARDDLALNLLRDAGQIAVGVASKYTGPAAPVTAKVGDYAVDKGVDHLQAGAAARAQTDQHNFDQMVDEQVTLLLAQAYYALPQYRALVTTGLPPKLQDAAGNIKDIRPGSPDMGDFNDWLANNNSFSDPIVRNQLAISGWINDQLVRP